MVSLRGYSQHAQRKGSTTGGDARKTIDQVCKEIEWKCGWHLDILAAAYAEEGKFDEAVRYENEALEDPAYQKAPAGDEFRQRLELYKQQKPFRQ